MELYSYFRSSAAFRLRIALNLKALDYTQIGINLLNRDHKSDDYLAINPQGLVPSIKTDEGDVLTQSPAILEWLEEKHPQIPLLPSDAIEKAKVRSWCFQIACDIHPICNLRVINYVANDLGAGEDGKIAWLQQWMSEGFRALEVQLSQGPFCNGEAISLADVYLVPQVFNALRFKVDMSEFPKITTIYENCIQHPAFIKARPNNQPDAV